MQSEKNTHEWMVCSQSTHFTWTRIRIVWMAWVCWAWRKLFRMYELPCYRMRIELMLNIHTLLMLWYTLSLHSMLLLLLVPAFLFSTWDLHSVHDQVFNCYCKQIAFHLVVDFISPSTFFDSIKDPHPQLWLVSWMLENGASFCVWQDEWRREGKLEADSFSYYYWNRFSEWFEY